MKKNHDGGVPPRYEQVLIYFQQKGMPDQEARDFFLYYESKNWCNSKGELMPRWKQAAYRWVMQAVSLQPWLFNRHLD